MSSGLGIITHMQTQQTNQTSKPFSSRRGFKDAVTERLLSKPPRHLLLADSQHGRYTCLQDLIYNHVAYFKPKNCRGRGWREGIGKHNSGLGRVAGLSLNVYMFG